MHCNNNKKHLQDVLHSPPCSSARRRKPAEAKISLPSSHAYTRPNPISTRPLSLSPVRSTPRAAAVMPQPGMVPPQPQLGMAPPQQGGPAAPPSWSVMPPPMAPPSQQPPPQQQYAPPPPQQYQAPPPPPPQMWSQAPPSHLASYGQVPPPPQPAAYYGAPSMAQAPPAGPNEVRTLWIGDLQFWMDENYVYNCFSSTGEVRSSGFLRTCHGICACDCFDPI
jgi:hypothetical protein